VGTGSTLAVSSIVGGSGPLTKAGAGTLTLSGANTYTGGTTINGGTLVTGNASALGTGALTMNGGTFKNGAAGANVTNNIIIGSGTNTITENGTNNFSFTGALSGAGNVTFGGGGGNASIRLAFSSNTMTSGTITLNGGTNGVARINNTASTNAAVDWVISGNTPSTEVSGTFNFGSLSGSGNLNAFNGNSGTTTYSVGGTNANTTYSGILSANGTGQALSVVKIGTGTWTLSGANTFTGGVSINGGEINVGKADVPGTSGPLGKSGTISFGGGALQYSALNQTDYSSRFSTAASQAYSVDTNGQSVTWGTALTSAGGSLAKSGSGTLTLTGANTYDGATSVTGGTLLLSGAGAVNGSSGITINGSGAKLVQTSSVAGTPGITLTQGTVDGTGSLGAVTVANLAANVVQNGNGGTSTLTLGGLAFNGAATLNIADIGTAGTPAINVTGALTTTPASGQVTINATVAGGAWSPTTYDLLGYGSFSGALSDFTQGTISGLTSRQSATLGLDTVNKFVTLTIAGDNPRWSGLDNGNWMVGSTGANSNWKLITTGTPTDYIQGDAVFFNDSAEGTTAVNISAANVSPTSVTFNNSTKAYTLSSSGGFGIAGTAALTKTGTGTVTISTVNSYSGGTNINNGMLALSGSGTLGSGTVTLGGGTLDLSGGSSTVGAVAITVAAASGNVIQNGTLTPSSLTASNSTGNAIVAASIAGSTAVTMNGTGTLTLSGANTYTGGTTIGNGTLVLASTGSLPTSNTLTLGSASGNTSGIFQLGDSNGAANTTVASIATAGLGTANAVVGGNSAVSTLTVDTAGTISYSGLLGGAGANQNNVALVKSGTGTLTLSGASTYSGGTTLNAGTLVYSNASAFGTGLVTLNGGTLKNGGAGIANNIVMGGAATFDLAGGNSTWSGNLSGSAALTLANSGGASTLSLRGDNSGYSGTITFNNNSAVDFGSSNAGSANAAWVFNDATAGRVRIDVGNNTINFGSIAGNGQMVNNTAGTTSTLSVGALNTSTTFGGTMKDNFGILALSKIGSGTLTLSGASTYTGATTIDGGTLTVNGSLASTGTVGFSSTGATLAGAGTVGAVTLTTGNFLAPGNGTTPIGMLTVNALTLNGGDFTFDLSGVDNTSDQIAVTNALTDGGTAYTFDFSGGQAGRTYTLLTFGSTNFADASKFSSTGVSGTFTLNANSLTFTAVPEPGVVALLSVGLFGMMTFVRRRKQMA
jgi:autotransporter-associated beta strand protein